MTQKKKKQEQYDDSDPRKSWKRITIGYRKWAQRYIAYCGQEYINKSFSRWAQEKLFFKGRQVYEDLNGLKLTIKFDIQCMKNVLLKKMYL